ncbi:MAG: aspartate kinase [Eubacteriales bacterium]
MKIIVQKYGGTSVNSYDLREKIIENLQKNLDKQYQCVIVVSAMGRNGDPYATDTLLKCISSSFYNSREMDMLISCGEIISSVVVACQLKKQGFKAIPLNGGQAGIITDNQYGYANIIDIQSQILIDLLKANKIPVIAGFQGYNAHGEITTLGRGGSDVSAVQLGIALHAERIEIFTDVDGIMTADPKIVSNAKRIEKIPYDDVFQLAEYGAKVIHPRAVEIAMKHNMPLLIYNTQKYDENSGTLIHSDQYGQEHLVAAVAHEHDQIQCRLEHYHSVPNIFEEIANHQISIDMINIFQEYCLFIIKKYNKTKMTSILEKHKIDYSLTENCTKVTVIGSSIRGVPGVMAKIIGAIDESTNILQTSDSHSTISILVFSAFADNVINRIHQTFQL